MTIQRIYERRGYSLLELSIVLGIVGIIVSALWGYMSSMTQATRVEQSVEAISLITESARAAYGGQAAISGGVAKVVPYLVTTGSMPNHLMLSAASTCQGVLSNYAHTPWGGSDVCGTLRVCAWGAGLGTAVAATNVCGLPAVGVGASQFLAVEFTQLTYQSCVTLATRAMPTSPIVGLGDVYINNNSSLLALGHLPVTPAIAEGKCTTVGGTANTVDFIYALRTPLS